VNFDRYIGIDYSGAETMESRLKSLQMYAVEPGREPPPVRPAEPARNWSRQEIAHWLRERIQAGTRLLIGIDHGFSFPQSYFERYRLDSWPAFLDDFCRYWPTDEPHTYVDFVRDGVVWKRRSKPPGERTGQPNEFRLCERWTSSAKSVFQFDVQGSVAKSTHAGIPWLRFLRRERGEQLFFWPFDGWQPPEGKSVIAEVYPSIFRNRYPKEERTPDEQDAYAVTRWLEGTSRMGLLDRYFNLPLTLSERRMAALEGWILGIG
jgi:hypothetical protein